MGFKVKHRVKPDISKAASDSVYIYNVYYPVIPYFTIFLTPKVYFFPLYYLVATYCLKNMVISKRKKVLCVQTRFYTILNININ